MKKLMAGAVVALLVSGVAEAGDKVEVEWGAGSKRFDVGELEKTSVCSLKEMVAEEFGLKIRKFDLLKSGRKLDDSKTLAGDYIYSYNKLQVKEVSGSFQCT